MKIGKTSIETTWKSIVEIVDGMITEVSHEQLEEVKKGGTVDPNSPMGKTGRGKGVKVISPNSREELDRLTRLTTKLLEDIISHMYFGLDLTSSEMKSDSSFLAKLSNRLFRKVDYGLEAPMAVGMYPNDRKVYLLINPVRLRFTVKTVGEIIAIVRHELYHILYQHLPESKGYASDRVTQYILNIAMDCEINQISMIKNELPDGMITLDYVREESGDHTLKEFAGYVAYYKALTSSEEYMEKIKEHMESQETKVYTQGQQGDGQGQQGDGEGQEGDQVGQGQDGQGQEGDQEGQGQGNEGQESVVDLGDIIGQNTHSSWGGDDISQDTAEKATEGIVKDTYNSLSDKERGLMSSAVRGEIHKLTHEPEINWRDKIKRQHGRMKSRLKRKTLARPNRRFPNRLDLKGKLPEYRINIVMALDVSGSVSDNALAYTMGEGYHLSKELDAPLTLLQIDAELASVQTIERPSDFDRVKLNARGGTRFQPAFDYLHEKGHTNKDTLLVYVTDGYGEPESMLHRRGFNNVLWVLVDTDSKEVLSCDGKGRVELLNNDSGYNN